MNSIVLWMRHGNCTDGVRNPAAHARPGSRISARGLLEVARSARKLRARRDPPVTLASSPLPRARQSAEIATRVLGLRQTVIIDTFSEWKAPQCVLGLSPNRYPPEYLAWRQQRGTDTATALAGGESLELFAERAQAAATVANSLAMRRGPLLVVSHRLLIGAIAALESNLRDAAEIFTFAAGFRLRPAAVWVPEGSHDELR